MLVSPQDPATSTVDRFPLNRLDQNYGVCSSSTSTTSASSIEDHPSVKREQHRRKLVGLHHAAFCTHVGHVPCPGHSHCLAHKRIFTHMNTCREGAKCIIPGCSKARLIWTHFSTCTDAECSVCSVIPEQDRRMIQPPVKVHLPRSPKLSTPTRRPGRPPLSPKPRCDLPTRSPPRSPSPKLP